MYSLYNGREFKVYTSNSCFVREESKRYQDNNRTEMCERCQEKYIKENELLMRRLNIYDANKAIELVNCCSNIRSIFFRNGKNHTFNEYSQYSYFHVNIKLPQLKQMKINAFDYSQVSKLFDSCLYEVKTFDPKKLKSLKLIAWGALKLNGLDVIKANFTKLKIVCLSGFQYEDFTKINCNINFIPSIKLEIDRLFDNNTKCFSNLKKCKSTKFRDYHNWLFKNIKSYNLSLLKDIGTISLGYFKIQDPIDKEFLKILTVKEIDYFNLINETLDAISLKPNIKILHLDKKLMFSIKKIFGKYFTNNSSIQKHNLDSLQCKCINHIKVGSFSTSYKDFLSFLFLFPNLETFTVRDYNLNENDT